MSKRRRGSGHLRGRLASPQEGERFTELRAPSPAPQAPPFLRDLPGRSELYEPKFAITKKLEKLIEEHSYEGAFQSAITTVASQNIPELRRIHTLSQFYFFVDAIVSWMPELRVWEWQGEVYHERTDYLRITQFCYYFNQTELEALQSPIDPVQGEELTPVSLWMREFAVEWGDFLDTPASAQYLDSYKYGPEYNYQDYIGWKDGYGTFNEWFSRTFRNIDEQRPVAQPDDDRLIVFPAESTYVGQWAVSTPVDEPPEMKAASSITVKHVEWPIPELLKDSEYGKDFEGGILVHSFLNVYDYHRQHAPVSGEILEAKFIPGQVYLEVALEVMDKEERAKASGALANAVIPHRYLDAADNTGYQFVQCRGLMVLKTRIGKVAVLPMGMAQVSSVVFVKPGTQELIQLTPEEKKEWSYDRQVEEINRRLEDELVGRPVRKGDNISTFLFGGSDIVMVFERQSNVSVTATAGVHYPVRSQYAYANIARLLE